MQSPAILPRTSKQFKRRSARVQLRIPLVVEAGDESTFDAETVTVSKHGAKIRMIGVRGKLSCGERFRVGRRGQQSQTARVVWQDKRSDPHYGIELDDPGNFWGVYFPSKDGSDWRSARKPPVSTAAKAPTPAISLASPLVEPPPASKPEPAMADAGTSISALITGVSAAHMPLAERADLVFTRPDEASALLQHLVEPGAVVRMILPDQRIVKGRVSAVGGHRQAGKWRVSIKCEAQAQA